MANFFFLLSLSTIGLTGGARTQSLSSIEAGTSDGIKSEANASDSPAAYYIEYGFVPDESGHEPTFVRSVGRLFDFVEGEDFRIQEEDFRDSQTIQSSSAAEHSRSLAASMGLFSFGSASFSAAVSASTASSSSASVRTVRVDHQTRARSKIVFPILSPFDLQEKLADDVERVFNTMSPADIYYYYGAFRATAVELGGIVRTTVIRELRESEEASSVLASVSAQMSALTMSAAASFGSSTSAASAGSGRTSTSIVVHGGDVQMWLGVGPGSDYSEVQSDWAATAPDRLAATNFRLEPLSRTIRLVNPEKADAFDAYCEEKWGLEAAEVARQQNALNYAAEF